MSEINKIFEIIRYPEVGSTNSVAFDLANRGAYHGTVVLAEYQSGGKGRLSRVFESPPGGLYMSVILRPDLLLADLPLLTLAAGVASAVAIEKCTQVDVSLKWPNDLYVNERKLGGILTEASPYSQKSRSVPFVITGFGINVNSQLEMFPESLAGRITSLSAETGSPVDMEKLVKAVAEEFLVTVDQLQVDAETILRKWRDRDYLSGKSLQWCAINGDIITGIGVGLLPDGRYRLTSSEGDDYSVIAGDLEVTAINGKQIK